MEAGNCQLAIKQKPYYNEEERKSVTLFSRFFCSLNGWTNNYEKSSGGLIRKSRNEIYSITGVGRDLPAFSSKIREIKKITYNDDVVYVAILDKLPSNLDVKKGDCLTNYAMNIGAFAMIDENFQGLNGCIFLKTDNDANTITHELLHLKVVAGLYHLNSEFFDPGNLMNKKTKDGKTGQLRKRPFRSDGYIPKMDANGDFLFIDGEIQFVDDTPHTKQWDTLNKW